MKNSPHRPFSTPVRRLPALLLAAALTTPAASAFAQAAFEIPGPPPLEERQAEAVELSPQQQFNVQLRERNSLYRKLYRLDAEAASAVKRGEEPIETYARQQSAQDRLNVVEMRLAILSSRHRFDVPEPPESPSAEAARRALSGGTDASERREKAESIAADGIARTEALLREQVRTMLAGLRFEGFPKR